LEDAFKKITGRTFQEFIVFVTATRRTKPSRPTKKKKSFSIIEKQLSVAAKLQLLRRTIKRET
jgi:hypothetical protein